MQRYYCYYKDDFGYEHEAMYRGQEDGDYVLRAEAEAEIDKRDERIRKLTAVTLNLIAACEKAQDWGSDTRVGAAISDADAALNETA